MLQEILATAFQKHQIQYWGLCPIEPLLPFFANRAATRVPPGVKSAIVCLLPYFTGEQAERNLSYYAIIPDYHLVAGRLLQDVCGHLARYYGQNSFVPFVDLSPIDEVKAAALCGLGSIGQNSLLINREYGALCFIGSILTDLEAPPIVRVGNEGCTHCGRCIKTCPAAALGPKGLDPSHCLSALTQQKKPLSPQQIELICQNKLAWGCDQCSLACPIPPKLTPIREFYEEIEPTATPQNLDRLMCNRAFAYRGKAVMLRNLNILGVDAQEPPTE